MKDRKDARKDSKSSDNNGGGMGDRGRFGGNWRRVWMFDTLVWTVMGYGVEIWGWKEREGIEKSTVKILIMGALGRGKDAEVFCKRRNTEGNDEKQSGEEGKGF